MAVNSPEPILFSVITNVCLVIHLLRLRFTLPRLFRPCRLCHRHLCRVHICQESPFGKGWFGINLSWAISSALHAGRAGVGGVSLAQLSLLFHRFRCRRIHSHLESNFWKGWVGHNSSGKYHLPLQREEWVWVECTWRR